MRLNRAALTICLCGLLLVSAPLSAFSAPTYRCAADQLGIQTGSGVVSLTIELADSAAERAQGLMDRASLERNTGMLFLYDSPQPVSFWMRNTLIPLDLLFVDDKGVIRHIHRNAQPLDETPIPGAAIGDAEPERLIVVEIGGGEAERLGVSVGNTLAYPEIDQSTAAWPCAWQGM